MPGRLLGFDGLCHMVHARPLRDLFGASRILRMEPRCGTPILERVQRVALTPMQALCLKGTLSYLQLSPERVTSRAFYEESLVRSAARHSYYYHRIIDSLLMFDSIGPGSAC